jgi:AAA+ ATPase superfamily predicted ATPase
LTSQFFPITCRAAHGALPIFGGIPFYWEQIDPALSIDENLRRKVFTPSSLLDAEAQLLLSDYVRKLKNYVEILKAIRQRNNTLKDISKSTGIPATQLPAYLGILADAAMWPASAHHFLAHSTRAGRYYITDPFLRFYFRFIAAGVAVGLFEPDQR